MPSLENLRGEKVVICFLRPPLDAKENILVCHLIEVEAAGVWIEATDFAEATQKKYNKALSRTPVLFAPFAQIEWLLSFAEYPYLSEKALG